MAEAQVAALPPLLQLECRARWALGDVPTYDEGVGNKRTETHVNLQLQRQNHDWFCEWQARLGITVAYSLDATHTVAQDKDGIPLRDCHGEVVHIDARAAVRHDGVVLGGILETAEGGKNYTGELCAHIDAAVDAWEGWAATSGVPVRVAYVFDAT